MKLHYQKLGSGHPIIILHGLYGSGHNWLSIARELAGFSEVYLVDQRNHGQSPHVNEHTYPDMMDDLKVLLDDLQIERAMLLGHSMGGKTAMFFATHFPGRVSKLLVADMSPLSYIRGGQEPAQVHGHKHIIESLIGLDLDSLRTLKEIDEELAHHLPDKRLRQFLFKNLHKKEQEGYSWRLNLPVLLNNLSHLIDGLSLADLNSKGYRHFPALFIRGGESNYIQVEDEQAIRQIFPSAQIKTIAGAGHWLHAERPEEFVNLVKRFVMM